MKKLINYIIFPPLIGKENMMVLYSGAAVVLMFLALAGILTLVTGWYFAGSCFALFIFGFVSVLVGLMVQGKIP